MVVPNHGFFFTKNDQHLGWGVEVPPFKETPISSDLTLPPIIMVQWKLGVSPISVSFHLG